MAPRRRVVWAPRAQTALDEAVEFIAEHSTEGALHVLDQALSAATSLSTLSERGRLVPEVNDSSLREIFVFRYRLIYEVHSDRVRIVAFLHGARDFDSWRRRQ